MAKFCPECPLSGLCKEEIVGLDTTMSFKSRLSGGTIPRKVGAFRDEHGNRSAFIYVPYNESEASLLAAVADCEYPLIEEQGFLWMKKEVSICRALGQYAGVDQKYVEFAANRLPNSH